MKGNQKKIQNGRQPKFKMEDDQIFQIKPTQIGCGTALGNY